MTCTWRIAAVHATKPSTQLENAAQHSSPTQVCLAALLQPNPVPRCAVTCWWKLHTLNLHFLDLALETSDFAKCVFYWNGVLSTCSDDSARVVLYFVEPGSTADTSSTPTLKRLGSATISATMLMTAGKLMAHVASDVDATSIVGRECPVRDTSSGVNKMNSECSLDHSHSQLTTALCAALRYLLVVFSLWRDRPSLALAFFGQLDHVFIVKRKIVMCY